MSVKLILRTLQADGRLGPEVKACTVRRMFAERGLTRTAAADGDGSKTLLRWQATLQLMCSRLGITLLHARPYDASARGKMERFWRRMREEALSHIGQVTSPAEVELKLRDWLARYYQRDPESPLRWTCKSTAKLAEALREMGHKDLDELARDAAAEPSNRRESDRLETTRSGLKVRAKLDRTPYPPGIDVTDAELRKVDLRTHAFHGDWNYTIATRSRLRTRSVISA